MSSSRIGSHWTLWPCSSTTQDVISLHVVPQCSPVFFLCGFWATGDSVLVVSHTLACGIEAFAVSAWLGRFSLGVMAAHLHGWRDVLVMQNTAVAASAKRLLVIKSSWPSTNEHVLCKCRGDPWGMVYCWIKNSRTGQAVCQSLWSRMFVWSVNQKFCSWSHFGKVAQN